MSISKFACRKTNFCLKPCKTSVNAQLHDVYYYVPPISKIRVRVYFCYKKIAVVNETFRLNCLPPLSKLKNRFGVESKIRLNAGLNSSIIASFFLYHIALFIS